MGLEVAQLKLKCNNPIPRKHQNRTSPAFSIIRRRFGVSRTTKEIDTLISSLSLGNMKDDAEEEEDDDNGVLYAHGRVLI